MSTFKDLTGQKFNLLTVIELSTRRANNGGMYWKCECDCGTLKEVTSQSLLNGTSKSCGCSCKPYPSEDLTGQKFNRLLAVEKLLTRDKKNNIIYRCLCDCGKEKVVSASSLKGNRVKSCGCIKEERKNKLPVNNLVGKIFGRLIVLSVSDNRDRWNNTI